MKKIYATVKAMNEIWTEFCLFDSGIFVRGYLKSKVYTVDSTVIQYLRQPKNLGRVSGERQGEDS